jgi:hypothetical protein
VPNGSDTPCYDEDAALGEAWTTVCQGHSATFYSHATAHFTGPVFVAQSYSGLPSPEVVKLTVTVMRNAN